MRSPSKPLSTAIAIALLAAGTVHAGNFTYRGHLDDGGAPAQGLYDLRLTPYSEAKVGLSVTAPIELLDLSVTDGRFAAELPADLLPDSLERVWLQVEVREAGSSGWTALPGRQLAEIKGAVCPLGWELGGNAGTDPSTHFLGTTDFQPLTLRVGNSAALRLQPGGGIPSVIGGSVHNSVAPGTPGAVIAGGGSGPTQPNTIGAQHGAIVGGYGNTVTGGYGFIGAGIDNTVGRHGASVTGGESNTASGASAAVSSGVLNCAGGTLSWAGGFRAKVRPGTLSGEPGQGCAAVPLEGLAGDSGTFVWADDQNADFVSSGSRQFLVRAQGGAVITGGGVNSPEGSRLRVDGTLRVDTLGAAGANALCRNASNQIASCSSSARYKSDIVALDIAPEVLVRLRPVAYTWTESGEADIGFVAEEIAAIDARLVTRNAEGKVEGVKYERLSALLASALQQVVAKQEEQADALAALHGEQLRLTLELRNLRNEQAQVLARLQRQIDQGQGSQPSQLAGGGR